MRRLSITKNIEHSSARCSLERFLSDYGAGLHDVIRSYSEGARAACAYSIAHLLTITAIAFSLTVLAGCAAPLKSPAVDSDLSLYNSTARLEFDHGSLAFAAIGYAKALDRARIIDEPGAIAEAAYNLAICRAALGDYSAAERCLAEAEHELARTGNSTADVLLAEARISLLQHQPTIAARLAAGVLTRADAKPTDEQRLQAHVVAGLAACQSGDTAAAKSQLTEANALVAVLNDPSSQAIAANLSGEVDVLLTDFPAACKDFDREASLRKSAAQYRDMNRALAKAGRCAARAGDNATAADRLYRAARAAISKNDPDAAALLVESRAAAQSAHDDALIRLTQDLTLLESPASQPATNPAP